MSRVTFFRLRLHSCSAL